jgi:hypothetical protein
MGAGNSTEILQTCDEILRRLLNATLKFEALTAERDKEVADIQRKYATRIAAAMASQCELQHELEAFYGEHRAELEPDGKKSVQLGYGLVGMRAPSSPALVPLNSKWTWESIAERVREVWKKKFFHRPKPPGLDKVKLKKELSADELADCGLKLDTTESFYFELNRLADQSERAA